MVHKWELVMLKWEGNIHRWEVEVIALPRRHNNSKARKSQANADVVVAAVLSRMPLGRLRVGDTRHYTLHGPPKANRH
jgi:hypothetical protein